MTNALELLPGPAGWVEAQTLDERGIARAWVRFTRSDDERWSPVALFVADPDPARLRTLPLRRIEVAVNASAAISERLAALADQAAAAAGTADFFQAFSGYLMDEPTIALKRPKGRRLDDAWYVKVADAYRLAAARGLKPRTTIAEAAGVSTDVAGRWVYEARKRGHLPKTQPGRVTA